MCLETIDDEIKTAAYLQSFFYFTFSPKPTYKGTIVLYVILALEKTGKQSNFLIYEIIRVYAMSRKKVEQSSLNKEDLVVILETAKEMGTKNQEINTIDFVDSIKNQLIKAMRKHG